jgi:single-strand DNA-binding protein
MYQKIFLAGNLGRDPETRYTPGGMPVTSFSLATNERWTDQDGQPQERTTWWQVSVWGKQGETIGQYLSKGRQVFIEGRMNPDSSTGGPHIFTRRDGTAGASYEVTAIRVRLIGGRGGAASFAGPRDEDVPPEAYFGED